MEDDLFYVQIPEHLEFRRNLLLSSRSLIEMLKQSERINILRNEKLMNIAELRKMIEEIVLLNRKLKISMPGLRNTADLWVNRQRRHKN